MVFDREKVDAISPDQIQHYERIDDEFAQFITRAKLFFKTFNRGPCLSRAYLMLQE